MTTCAGPSCGREATARTAMCKSHNRQVQRGQTLAPLRRYADSTPCAGPGPDGTTCTDRAASHGLCPTHDRQVRRGKPLTVINIKTWTSCRFETCERRGTHKGLCPSHRRQEKKGNELTPLVPRQASKCREPGCPTSVYVRDMCSRHYSQKRRANQGPKPPAPPKAPAAKSKLPPGWFAPTLRTPSAASRSGRVSHDAIGMPIPNSRAQRAKAEALIRHYVAADAEHLLDMILDINTNQKEHAHG